jgi:hypothetical protein
MLKYPRGMHSLNMTYNIYLLKMRQLSSAEPQQDGYRNQIKSHKGIYNDQMFSLVTDQSR